MDEIDCFIAMDLHSTPADIESRRERGARYQAWLDDPNVPGCPVRPATLDWTNDILQAPLREDRFELRTTCWEGSPEELQGSLHQDMNIPRDLSYRHVKIIAEEPGPDGSYSMYENITARGIIIAESIWRHGSGPMWNEIARAQYVMDHATLSDMYWSLQL
jgi:hypothetical protein